MNSPLHREEIDGRLRELMGMSELSFADITWKINEEFRLYLTRGSVMGHAYRKGYKKNIGRKGGGSKPKPKRLHGTAEQNAVRSITAKRIEYPPVIDDQIPLEQRKTILELTENTCRWPVGDHHSSDFFFCGAEPLPQQPYCGPHCARAFTNHPHGWERPDAAARLRKWRYGSIVSSKIVDGEAA
jgi:hypothetical protein